MAPLGLYFHTLGDHFGAIWAPDKPATSDLKAKAEKSRAAQLALKRKHDEGDTPATDVLPIGNNEDVKGTPTNKAPRLDTNQAPAPSAGMASARPHPRRAFSTSTKKNGTLTAAVEMRVLLPITMFSREKEVAELITMCADEAIIAPSNGKFTGGSVPEMR